MTSTPARDTGTAPSAGTPGSPVREDTPADFDALAVLRRAGLPVDILSVAQQDVLAGLSPSEADVIGSVKRRLDAAEPEVVGHDLKVL